VTGLVYVWLLMATYSLAATDNEVVSDKRPEKYDWTVIFYTAKLSRNDIGDMMMLKPELTNNNIYVAALTQRLNTFYKDVDLEVEGQVALHQLPCLVQFAQSFYADLLCKNGGPAHVERNWELNMPISLRWNHFPWDSTIETSVAAGVGFSYANELPEFEIELHGRTKNILFYSMVEMDFSMPNHPDWVVVTRIHHRSSMSRVFNNNIVDV
ncbi:uncharacterized protein METZ01_LOCUS455224, partial [marine metagenome]